MEANVYWHLQGERKIAFLRSMRLITSDDFIDVYCKLVQRGPAFLLSKLQPFGLARTRSAFDKVAIRSSNWWDIPAVVARKNLKLSGQSDVDFTEWLILEHFREKESIKMLSPGSGTCSQELKWAAFQKFEHITCIDIAANLLHNAEITARKKQLNNIEFVCSDVKNYPLKTEEYDVIIFNSSLHHFKEIETLLSLKIKPALKSDGLLVINEYVGPNRFQFDTQTLNAINEGLQMIPEKWRKRYKTGLIKNKVSGPGFLRTYMADPSEAVESVNILPAIHRHFSTVVEKPFGGNLLTFILKDIAWNFMEENLEKTEILKALFEFEDAFLSRFDAHYLVGVYRKKEQEL
jgi:ubiquinone/menaquinone biosynthesis C-methylase UbiE